MSDTVAVNIDLKYLGRACLYKENPVPEKQAETELIEFITKTLSGVPIEPCKYTGTTYLPSWEEIHVYTMDYFQEGALVKFVEENT